MIWLAGALFLVLSVVIIFVVLRVSSQVDERLNQMSQSLQDANRAIAQSLGDSAGVFGDVNKQLGRLEETNRQIIDISKNITSLQELLRAPKFRGQMGETLLENLLSQVLPKEHYRIQHRFKSGEAVDAAIWLGERLVPVDAKFSLENFQRLNETEDEQLKGSLRKKFIQDIRNRVDEIAAKYILPAENTYDFALMYIPAENVYYEAVIKEDILTYSMAKKVIPVSPNTLYAYLQVICLGLKGMKIEENAKEILKSLGALGVEINRFREDFAVLGTHITNAGVKYSESQKRLDKFSDKLLNIQETKKIEGGKQGG